MKLKGKQPNTDSDRNPKSSFNYHKYKRNILFILQLFERLREAYERVEEMRYLGRRWSGITELSRLRSHEAAAGEGGGGVELAAWEHRWNRGREKFILRKEREGKWGMWWFDAIYIWDLGMQMIFPPILFRPLIFPLNLHLARLPIFWPVSYG